MVVVVGASVVVVVAGAVVEVVGGAVDVVARTDVVMVVDSSPDSLRQPEKRTITPHTTISSRSN